MKEKNTTELLKVLNQIDHKKNLEHFIDNNKSNINDNVTLCTYLNNIIKSKKLKKSEVIKASGIPRTYAYQILQGQKNPNRDKLISLCIAISMNLDQVQRTLTIAQKGILYAKNHRDMVIIFAINRRFNILETNELLFDLGEKILE